MSINSEVAGRASPIFAKSGRPEVLYVGIANSEVQLIHNHGQL